MSKIWLSADSHYAHHNMLLFREREDKRFDESTYRKFRTTDEMHRHLRQRHNEVVSPEDTVYHLGDFAYGPGAKSWQQVEGFLKGLNGTHILIAGNHDHLKMFEYVEAGFQSVHTSLYLEDYLLIHDPAVAGVLKDQKVIHGHTHGIGKFLAENTFCVCGELWDYYPVDFEVIKEHFNAQRT